MLLAASFLLVAVVGLVASFALGGGWIGVVFGVVVAAGLTWFAYARSDTVALKSTHAQPASIDDFAQLHNVVEAISLAAGIPKPRVYVVNDPAPNAFATGKDPEHAAVAVTTGLLQMMDRDELEGVVAHELAHIRNYDIRVMTVAVATAGAIALISDFFWRMLYFGALTGGGRRNRGNNGRGNPLALVAMVAVAVMAPLAAALLKAAISRKRESLADATAVAFTRYPAGLRRALEKLDADSTVVQHTSHATSHLWIESPDDTETGHEGAKLNQMFSTHPPLSERINTLRAMEGLETYSGPDPAILADLARRTQAPPNLPTPADPVTQPIPGASRRPAAASMPQLDDLFAPKRPAQSPGASLQEQPASRAAPDPGTNPATNPPSGWYRDPAGAARTVRYWDGNAWTSHTARR